MSEPARRTNFLKSSHFRMTIWYTVLIGILSVAFGMFLYVKQSQEIYGESLFRISKGMNDLLRALDHGQEVSLRTDEVFAVIGANGQVLRADGIDEKEALSLVASVAGIPPTAVKDAGGGRQSKGASPASYFVKGDLLFGYTRLEWPDGISPGGHLLYGAPLDPYGLKRKLLVDLLLALILMLASAILSGAWLANKSMKPVAQIAKTAKAIGDGDLSRRIRLESRDELGEISSVFDEMLDRLEAAFVRQKRFVADAGHELRTPLSIIMLETESSLASDRPAEEYRKSLSSIRNEGGYMSKLVDDLLTLARADEGGVTASWKPVDLADVVLEAMERYAPLASAKGITLVSGELPETIVRGDRKALAMVVGNLLDNAVKYGLSESGRVDLCLDSQGDAARIAVSDNGPGIALDKIGKIFDRFYRTDESRTEDGSGSAGSGLGLAIAKAIVEAHKGRIEVKSTLNAGTEFTVILPLMTRSAK